MRLRGRYILILNTVSKKTVLFTFLLVAFVPTAFSQQARFQTIQFRWYTDEEPCDRVYKSPTDRIRSLREGLAHRVGIIEGESRTCVPRNSPGYNSIYGSTGTFIGRDGTSNATLVGDGNGGYALLVSLHSLVDDDGIFESEKFMFFPDAVATEPRLEIDVDEDQLVKQELIGENFGVNSKKVKVEDDWALIPLSSPLKWVGAKPGFNPKPFKLTASNKEDYFSGPSKKVFAVGNAKPLGETQPCLSRQGPYDPFQLSSKNISPASLRMGRDPKSYDGDTFGVASDAVPGNSGTPYFSLDDGQLSIRGITSLASDLHEDYYPAEIQGRRRHTAVTMISDKVIEAYKRAMDISRGSRQSSKQGK